MGRPKKKKSACSMFFFTLDGNENLSWMKSDRPVKILKALKF